MKTKIIFFGNGPLADYSLSVLEKADFDIIFHARKKEDLEQVVSLKTTHPDAHGILASFGVIIKSNLLELFEPEGILNIHPSLLPEYRGPSPIETAILNGDTSFSVSIMKLVKAMDAGPIYYQATLSESEIIQKSTPDSKLPPKKDDSSSKDSLKPSKNQIYEALATTGAEWLVDHLEKMPLPAPQNDDKATYTEKLSTTLSELKPSEKPAESLQNEIRAFAKFPKSKYTFYGLECIIHATHVSDTEDSPLSLKCQDGKYLIIDQLQPAGRKSMDAKSFLNGYAKR